MARWTFVRFRCHSCWLLVCLSYFAGGRCWGASTVEFREGAFWLSGRGDRLEVFAADGDSAIPGSLTRSGGFLVFHPRYPVSPGVRYRAVFEGGQFILEPSGSTTGTTVVEQVYPTSGVLPANVLKFYIQFSAPMRTGEAWSHLHLVDARGETVQNAFLELDEELWDPGHRRLTVLFDPARIKRGLVPAREQGAPIVEGERYSLVIDAGWRDSMGATLARGYRKEFVGGAADRMAPEVALWRVRVPRAGSLEPLVATFPKPMDFALIQRMLWVEGVEGTVATGEGETEWRFTPLEVWRAGKYRLVADARLEDIAGNHPSRLFDVDLTARGTSLGRPDEGAATVSLSFEVR